MSDELVGGVLVAVLIYVLIRKSEERENDETAASMWLLEKGNHSAK